MGKDFGRPNCSIITRFADLRKLLELPGSVLVSVSVRAKNEKIFIVL